MLGFAITVVLLIALIASIWPGANSLVPSGEIAYSTFIADVGSGKVNYVTLEDSRITGGFQDGRVFRSFAPPQALPALIDRMTVKNITIVARPADNPTVVSVLAGWLPFLACYALFFGTMWLLLVRPLLAFTRQLEAYVRTTQERSSGPASSQH